MNTKTFKKETPYQKINILDLHKEELKFIQYKPKSSFKTILVGSTEESKVPILLLPKLKILFETKINKYNQCDITLGLDDCYSPGYTTDKIKEALKELDELVINLAKDQKWPCGNAKYSSFVKDSTYGNHIKLKLSKNYKTQEIDSVFFNEKKELLDVKYEKDLIPLLRRDTLILTSIELTGIYFNESYWGILTKLHQTKIFDEVKEKDPEIEEQPNESNDIEFMDSSDDEVEDDY